MWQVWVRREECIGSWWGNRREGDHWGDLGLLLFMKRDYNYIKSRRMRWAGHVARMDEEKGVYRVFVRKPEGRRLPGRPRLRWVDNIKMDLQEVGCGYMD